MYVSTYELKQNTLDFINSNESVNSPNQNATARRLLWRLNQLDRNSLSVPEIHDLILDSTILPWFKEHTTQAVMSFILGGGEYA